MLERQVKIGETPVGGASKPYVIAEIGSNFDQDIDKARKLIDVAADAGANAVKLQLFRADVLYPNGGDLHDLFRSIELDPDWVPLLSQHATENGLHFLASAFDVKSVEVLEAVKAPAYKVASSETTNLFLLRRLAATGKPLIVSTGMCEMIDIEEAINVCIGVRNPQVVLLQCGAMYPLPNELANLRVLQSFTKRFDCPVGFSDHTLGHVAAIVAVGLGATVFEKHFTLDRSASGPDHSYALEPDELRVYISAIREAHEALGSDGKQLLPSERALGRRDGLYVARRMSKGETLTSDDIVIRRPAAGLPARYASAVVGAKLAHAMEKEQPLTWDALATGRPE